MASGNTNRGVSEQQPSGPTTGGLQDKARELASTAAARAGEVWEQTAHAAQGLGSRVAGQGGDTWDDVTRFMRQNPLATLAIGATVGFMLARLFDAPASSRAGGSLYVPTTRGDRDDFYPYAK